MYRIVIRRTSIGTGTVTECLDEELRRIVEDLFLDATMIEKDDVGAVRRGGLYLDR